MINFIKEWLSEKKDHMEMTDMILKDWEDNPMDWRIDEYYASKWKINIWISNSPYADMKMNGMRLPNRWLLRKKLLELKIIQARNQFTSNK